MQSVAVRAGLVVVIALAVMAVDVRADAVDGQVFPHRQPDGSVLQLRVWGDEFYAVAETLDGYTVVRDPESGFVCYARVAKDGNELISTGVVPGIAEALLAGLKPHLRITAEARRTKARQVREQFEAARWEGMDKPADGAFEVTTLGNVRGITLLVDFSDDPGTVAPATVDNFCNQVGYSGSGNNGSVRDYFYDVSDGRLTYTNYVPTAYYRAAQPKSYYTDPNIGFGTRARELLLEALNALDNSGFDFSQYDVDGNGKVDGINCFYAGPRNSAWSQGLWPHAWSVNFCADGVCTQRYQITDMGSGITLSTFCHENGHMLCGFPDLYDYDYDSNGVGRFCIMCYATSSTNPQEPCGYLKHVAGWTTTSILTVPWTGVAVPSNSNTIYKYDHPMRANEFYIIENRHKSDRDAGLPDAGLAIWHIDTYGNNDNQQMTAASHYLVTLVQADGRWDLENERNHGDTTDLWKAPTYTTCTTQTTPNTCWWDGLDSNLSITGVSAAGTTMTFNFSGRPYSRMPDFDNDNDVDLDDFGIFQRCLSGSGVTPGDPACLVAQLDEDGDVDGQDVAKFRGCLSGPGILADPHCAD